MTLKHVAWAHNFFLSELYEFLALQVSIWSCQMRKQVGRLFVFIISLKRLELVSLLRESCKHSWEWASRHSILSILISGAREKEIYWVYFTKSILHPTVIIRFQFHPLINPHTHIRLVFLYKICPNFSLINVSWFLSFYTSTSW